MANTVEERVAALNQKVAEFQRSGQIAEGVQLADESFFLALEELPRGSFLLAQAARNRSCMQQMAGNPQEAIKSGVVAFDNLRLALEQTRKRRVDLEQSGQLREAKDAAAFEVRIARMADELRPLMEVVQRALDETRKNE